MTESVKAMIKTRKSCVSSIRSKALCLGFSEPTKPLAVLITAYTSRNRQGKQAFFEENKKIYLGKRNL